MKKRYKKPLTSEVLVKSDSLLYVTSIDYGGEGEGTHVDAGESEIWDWDDKPYKTESGSSLWDDE